MLPQFPGRSYPKEVCLNGKWMKPEDAKISVFDRGFMLGDSLYEVIPFYEGKVFALEEHFSRLEYCLKEIRLDYPVDKLIPFIKEAVARSDFSTEDSAVYLQVSRGAAPRTHFFPDTSEPVFLLYAFPVKLRGFEERNWRLLVSEDIRWQRCDIKSTSYLANTMLNDESHSLGLDETLLVKNGKITEGSHSTAFFVKNGVVFTHPEGTEILSGITRKIVIGLCRELEVPFEKKPFLLDQIKTADEVFLTGTTTQVMTVSEIISDGEPIFKSGKVGPITRKLQHAFIKLTRNFTI